MPRWIMRLTVTVMGLTFAMLIAPQVTADEAARMLVEANRLDRAADRAAALDAYRLLTTRFPDRPEAAEALARSAELYAASGERASAEQAIARLRADHPASVAAARGELLSAELQIADARGLADLTTARTTLLRLPLAWERASYPELPARARARVEAARLAWLLGDLETAIAEALLAAEDEPAGPWTREARLLWARASLAADAELAPVIEVLQRTANEAADGETTGATAERWLSLIHRRRIGPAVGRPWIATARRFPSSGPSFEEASGVAANHDTIIVTDTSLPVIALLATTGEVRVRTAVNAPIRPWWDTDGNAGAIADDVLVRPFGGPRVTLRSPRGDDALDDVEAVTDDLFGRWWAIARRYDETLLVYDTPESPRELRLEGARDLQDLARDDRGRVYALDRRTKTITRIDADGSVEGVLIRGDWKRATALDVDPLGYVWLLDEGARRIELWDEDGRLLTRLGPTLPGGLELRDPIDIAVDDSGRVYVADENLPHLVVLD